MHEITVRPCLGSRGWILEQDAAQPISFMSGAKAETAALALANRMASVGRPTRATFILRTGKVAGQFTVA